jgi:hypothetical protein
LNFFAAGRISPFSALSFRRSIHPPDEGSPLYWLTSRLPARAWGIAAALAWAGALIGLVIRAIAQPERATNTARFLRAGEAWIAGDDLYRYAENKGFVYSPLAAVLYAASTYLPTVGANILWIAINFGLLLWGLREMLRVGPFRTIPPRYHGLVFLLLFPLSLGNLDSAQPNPIVIGFVMLGVASAAQARWMLAAAAVAGAVFWKVYPLAVGMLLVLCAPVQFSWRLILVLLIGAFLPFLFQSREYVSGQYWLWWDTRTSDNRLAYDASVAPLDLWYVLVRFLGLPLDPLAYRAIQLAGAAAIAAFVAWGAWNHWPKERLLGGLFCFVCVWMTLLGLAVELHAYLLLGPAVVLAVVETWSRTAGPALRVLSLAAYGILLLAILRVAFVPRWDPAWILSLQPVGATVFLAYCILRYVVPPRMPSPRS